MLPPRLEVPRGYARRDIDAATLIARDDVIEPLAAAVITSRELIEFAKGVPSARPLQGRQTAYAIPIGTTGVRGVVRRNHHGGVFGKWTGSRFFWPTRAPKELAISLALGRMNIPTPPVIAIAIYRADMLAMSDVVTEEIPDSHDFGAHLLSTQPGSDDRRKGWNALESLLGLLAVAGVRHHDLNVKNVLLRRTGSEFEAYALDVDRVRMDLAPREADQANRTRLCRSLEKWRDTRGARVSDEETETLRRTGPSIP